MSRKLVVFIIIALALLAIGIIKPVNTSLEDEDAKQHEDIFIDDKNEGFDEKGNLKTHLPIIVIDAKGESIPGSVLYEEDVLTCGISVIDNKDEMNTSTDPNAKKYNAEISVRDSTSAQYPKKSYDISLLNKFENSENEKILGMPYARHWVLDASYTDRSLFRNYMMYSLCAQFMKDTPEGRLCEVIITDENNNPQYMGVYTLREEIEVAQDRLSLLEGKSKKNDTSFLIYSAPNIEGKTFNHLISDEFSMYPYRIEYPDEQSITPKMIESITSKVSRMEKLLYDGSRSGDWTEAEKEIDADSFADYFIINEFFQNYEVASNFIYLKKDMNKKFEIGPVWDFEKAINNYDGVDFSYDSFQLKYSFYYVNLTQNPDFVRKTVYRYRQLRLSVLSDEILLKYIDSCDKYISSAARRDSLKWYGGDYAGRTDDVAQMKKFVVERGKWMDENFNETLLMTE